MMDAFVLADYCFEFAKKSLDICKHNNGKHHDVMSYNIKLIYIINKKLFYQSTIIH